MLGLVETTAISQAGFAFGETHISFQCPDEEWLSWLDRRYGSFSTAPTLTDFVVRFEPTAAPLPSDLVSPLAPYLESVDCEPIVNGFRVRTATTDCEIDLDSRRAVLRGPSAMYPLDNVLRHLLPLLWEDGLILHTALIAVGHGSVLASGPSGAGKSTIARLARGRALSDELAAIRLAGGGATGIALPFWEARPGSARLRAILHLRHGLTNRIEHVCAEQALRKLASQVLWPVWDEAAMARSFGYLATVAETVPAFDLAFTPTQDVWELIDREVA
jgi:hypothetical protein